MFSISCLFQEGLYSKLAANATKEGSFRSSGSLLICNRSTTCQLADSKVQRHLSSAGDSSSVRPLLDLLHSAYAKSRSQAQASAAGQPGPVQLAQPSHTPRPWTSPFPIIHPEVSISPCLRFSSRLHAADKPAQKSLLLVWGSHPRACCRPTRS